ncbi:hypothetical protein [Stutzerimonas stutzeri]|uniref:hypothetical protein n=1 Tax=Stutzerimonas stutzeri TaxID=316 RepID=UPI0015E3452A|nr:hypothetical protein [Stutzerimonas stutzeri]MBA1280318.1 hypothetical protein [Stutzerimonas stutzeri]
MKGYAVIAAMLIGGLPTIGTLSFFSSGEMITLSVMAALCWLACFISYLHKGMRLHGEIERTDACAGPKWLPAGKQTDQKDKRFGHVFTTEEGNEHYLCLSSVLSIAKHDTASAFTAHLARLLASLPERSIVLAGETSNPQLGNLLEKLPRESIDRIVIRARSDVNINVKATLECSLHTAYGIVDVRPDWTAWKPSREEEIITTLLAPLTAHSLLGRLILEVEGREQSLPGNFHEIIKAVLRISGYPYQRDQAADDRMNGYVRILIEAQAQQRVTSPYEASGSGSNLKYTG